MLSWGSLLQRTDTSANLLVQWGARGLHTREPLRSRVFLDRKAVQILQAAKKTAAGASLARLRLFRYSGKKYDTGT